MNVYLFIYFYIATIDSITELYKKVEIIITLNVYEFTLKIICFIRIMLCILY